MFEPYSTGLMSLDECLLFGMPWKPILWDLYHGDNTIGTLCCESIPADMIMGGGVNGKS